MVHGGDGHRASKQENKIDTNRYEANKWVLRREERPLSDKVDRKRFPREGELTQNLKNDKPSRQ